MTSRGRWRRSLRRSELDEDGEAFGRRDRPQVRGRRDHEPVHRQTAELRARRRTGNVERQRREAARWDLAREHRHPVRADVEHVSVDDDRAGARRRHHAHLPLRRSRHHHRHGRADLEVPDDPSGGRAAAPDQGAADEVGVRVRRVDLAVEAQDRVDVLAARVERHRVRERGRDQGRDRLGRSDDLELEDDRPDHHRTRLPGKLRRRGVRDAPAEAARIGEPDAEPAEAARRRAIPVVLVRSVSTESWKAGADVRLAPVCEISVAPVQASAGRLT